MTGNEIGLLVLGILAVTGAATLVCVARWYQEPDNMLIAVGLGCVCSLAITWSLATTVLAQFPNVVIDTPGYVGIVITVVGLGVKAWEFIFPPIPSISKRHWR